MLLRLSALTKAYVGTNKGVRNLNFTAEVGNFVGVFGLNGAGKTTLLKLIAGLLRPQEGSILVQGRQGRSCRHELAFLGDQDLFWPWMRIPDVERYMLAFYPDFQAAYFRNLCRDLEVPKQRFGGMSRGQKQRFKLAAILSREVSLYLLDEPLAGVDLISREKMIQACELRKSSKCALFLATHELQAVENMLDRALFLQDGQMKRDLSHADLQTQGSSFKEQFIEVYGQGY